MSKGKRHYYKSMTPEQIRAEDTWRREEIQKSQREAKERLLLNEPLFHLLQPFGVEKGLEVVYNQSYVIFRKLGRDQLFRHYLAVRKVNEGYELVVYDGGTRLRHTSRYVVEESELCGAVAKEVANVQPAN